MTVPGSIVRVVTELLDRAFTPDEAREVAAWSYDPPFDFYNLSGEDAVVLLTTRDEVGHGYYPVKFDEELVGLFALGQRRASKDSRKRRRPATLGRGLSPTGSARGSQLG